MELIQEGVLVYLICCFGFVNSLCNGISSIERNNSGTIQSPNFGFEYGKSANCTWKFDLGSRPAHALIITLSQLKLVEVAIFGRKICTSAYSFHINGERVGCNPPRTVDFERPDSCRAFYNSDECFSVQNMTSCKKRQFVRDDVDVTYISDGQKLIRNTNEPASFMWGFRLEYEFVKCRHDDSFDTTMRHSVSTKYTTTLKQAHDETKCMFRAISRSGAMSMVGITAGVVGIAFGAGVVLLIMKCKTNKDRSTMLPSTSRVSRFSNISTAVTGLSDYEEMRPQTTTTDQICLQANPHRAHSQQEGLYEVPMPCQSERCTASNIYSLQ